MLAISLGLLAALGWGTHDFLVRWIAPGTRVLPQVTVVMGVAALLLMPVLALTDLPHADGLGIGLAVAAGVVYFIAAWSLFAAFARAPARTVVPVIGAYPLPALAMAAAQGHAVGALAWLAAGLIALGLAVGASCRRQERQPQRWAALGFSVIAGLGLAISFTLGQAAALRIDGLAAPAISRIAAALASGLALMGQREALPSFRGQGRVLLAMGLMDAVALTAVMAAGTLTLAHFASVASAMYGMVTVTLAAIFLGEAVNRRQALGLALVFAGIAVLAAG